MSGKQRTTKAYKDLEFLNSPDARTLRIMAEYLYPLRKFRQLRVHDTIVFFGSSKLQPPATLRERIAKERALLAKSRGRGRAARRELERLTQLSEMSHYYNEAAELSARLTEWTKTLGPSKRFVVCSGAGPGIMEAANRGATEKANGLTVGLNISLPDNQPANPFITPELQFEFHYFFMRKYWFAYMAAAMVVFPGGFGTLDELFEILTLKQTRKIDRPLPIVVYGRKFWKDIIDWEALVTRGLVDREDLELFKFCDSVDEAFDFLTTELKRHYVRGVR